MKYNAFISYSTDPDYKLSRKLEKFLESFSNEAGRYESKLERLNVCRDGTNFRLNNKSRDGETINRLLEEHLGKSDYLIVLCSANAAKSNYCLHEIKWFIENKGADKILAAFTEGDNPPADIATYFCPDLIENNIHQTVCYDLRDYKKDSKDWKKVRELGEEMTKLAAHLYGRSINDIMPLWKRAERRQRIEKRISRILRTGITILFIMLIALGFQRNQVVKALGLSELKSDITGLANEAFKIKDNDRKVMYDTLMRAYDLISDENELSIEREKTIIKNLLTEVRINMTSLPLYTQTLTTQIRGEVLKIKTRGDKSGFTMFILSKEDNRVIKYFLRLNKKSNEFIIDRGTPLINPSGNNIELFEPAESELIFIYDNKKNLKLLDHDARLLDSVYIPQLVDFDFDKKTNWLYVATSTHWQAYKMDKNKHMTLIRQKQKKQGSQAFDNTVRLKNYGDGTISFLCKNKLYLIDDRFQTSPQLVDFLNEENKDIPYYKFDKIKDPSGKVQERALLAISRGRIVELYRKSSLGSYYKEHTIDDHLSFINSFDFNGANEIIVGSSDKTATVWSNNLLDKQLIGHSAAITDVSFVDDELAITCDESNVIRLWNLEELAVDVHNIGPLHPITKIKRIGDNRAGISAGDSSIIISILNDESSLLKPLSTTVDSMEFINAFTYHKIYDIMDSSEVEKINFIESGDTIFTGDKDGWIHIYHHPNTEPIHSLLAHDKAITDMDCTDGGIYLISGSKDNLVKVWKKTGSTYTVIRTLSDHFDDIVDIDVYKNLFLTVSHDRSVLLYEIGRDDVIKRNLSMIKHNTFINGAAFLNESIIASGDDEGIIKIWAVANFAKMWNQ